MVDADVVRARLARLDEQLRYLEPQQQVPRERFLAEHGLHTTAERDLQVAIECVLDIANHIVAADGLGEPRTYRETLELLGRAEVLEPTFAERIAPMASFRNILVHGYLELDREQVYAVLQDHLADLRTFAAQITAYLDRSDS